MGVMRISIRGCGEFLSNLLGLLIDRIGKKQNKTNEEGF